MRTSVLGIWDYVSSTQVRHNAANACRLTHADPRCVGSAIAVSLAISALLRGETEIDTIVRGVRDQVISLHLEFEDWFTVASQPEIQHLHLDPGSEQGMGYTLRTLAAAFWALQNAPSYKYGILAIIHEGGDADTNAAVTGALLGARFGYESLPEPWVKGLVYGDQLHEKAEQLLEQLTATSASRPISG
jgi:ADP-ribosylglycohydrolase